MAFPHQRHLGSVIFGQSHVSNIFTSNSGAKVCTRYLNGKLTNEPLWPWPMNQRIINAMVQSGRTPVDVTETITSLFGEIPGEGGGNFTSIPSPPTNLRVLTAY